METIAGEEIEEEEEEEEEGVHVTVADVAMETEADTVAEGVAASAVLLVADPTIAATAAEIVATA